MYAATQNTPSLVLYRDRPRLPLCGVGRLPAALTINGITEYPVLRYTAGGGMVNAGATVWSPWGYGEDLAVVAVGVAPTPRNGSPGLGVLDDSVLFNDSDYFTAGSTFADITTEDFVVEVVFRVDPVKGRLFGTWNGLQGWMVYQSDSTALRMLLDDTGVVTTVAGSLVPETWCHAICFMDRNGLGCWFINAVANATPSIAPTPGSLVGIALQIGNCGGHADAFPSNIAYCAMYKHAAGWFPSDAAGLAAQLVIAEQRASLFWGWRPQMARGTAVPTVRTRASDAYLDKCEGAIRKLYYVGNNVPRCVDRIDKNGARIRGYLPEVQTTNLHVRTEDFNTGWVKQDITSVSTDVITAPNGLAVADGLIPNIVAGNHAVYQTINLSAVKYCRSVWAKNGPLANTDFIKIHNTTLDNCTAWFDLVNGVAGTIGAGTIASGIENWGDGWYRCWHTFTAAAGNNILRIYVTSADGVGTSTGDAVTISTYLFGAQLESGVDYPTSYMPSPEGAQVIREEDVLRYRGDDSNLGGVGSNRAGELRCKMLCEDYDSTLVKNLITISDAGDAADAVELAISAADVPTGISAASAGAGGLWTGTTDVVDGAVHALCLPYQTDDLGPGLVDEAVESVADTDCGMPDEVDRIDIGASVDGLLQPNTVVADVECLERVQRRVL